ncbi:MAG: T9SS type A sorting domain-containing protein [Saprospiraceae bacterium]|nr:T9SS type A sorting domain-containing protein [Saprospiraceae bacterium]
MPSSLIKIFFLLCISFIIQYNINAQKIEYFNLLPDMEAARMQSQLKAIAADSHYIYVMGDRVSTLDSMGFNKDIDVLFTKFDYQGKRKEIYILKDSSLIKPYIANNRPLFRLNDSIYSALIYSIDNPNNIYANSKIIRFNFRTLILEGVANIDFPIAGNHDFESISQSSYYKGSLLFVFNFRKTVKSLYDNYLYEIDSNLNTQKIIKIPVPRIGFSAYRWINKNNNGEYEMVGSWHELINGSFTERGRLFYHKVDSLGKELKYNEISRFDDYFNIRGGQTFTIIRNDDLSFSIAASHWPKESRNYGSIPYIIKTSPTLDSVYWMTRFYEYPELVMDPDYMIEYMCKMKDESAVVVCGEICNSIIGNKEYGILFKASHKGDSLWLRKYQPLGWDSTRASWMSFNQVTSTPYNSLAVVARVADSQDRVIKGWLLHLDSDGCIVPGCNKTTSIDAINSGQQKVIEIYPNPIQDRLYMLSRINADEAIMTLLNLQGEIILRNKIVLTEGVQYVIDIPSSLPSSHYLLDIMAKDGKKFLSEKIVKE